jgi:hypothetical protein
MEKGDHRRRVRAELGRSISPAAFAAHV